MNPATTAAMETLAHAPTLAVLPELSAEAKLPAWVAERRAAARAEFARLPLPSRKDERWRFADVADLTLDGYALPPEPVADLQPLLDRTRDLGQFAGSLALADNQLAAWHEVSPELARAGVIFEPLAVAWERHPELVRPHFLETRTDLGSHKFEALHEALVSNGVFLYLPPNVEVELPFLAWHFKHGGAVFPHTIVVAGAHSKATFLEFFEGAAPTPGRHLACGVATIHAGPGSRLFYGGVQAWSPNTLGLHLQTNTAERDAQLTTFFANFGGRHIRHESHTRITGPGANVEMFSVGVASGEQEYDQRTLQTHSAPQARSDLLFKNALLDSARTIFSGLIRVDELAQRTDAYQTNRNLVLSEDAEANSLPGLEILANDVKCSHGATTGRLDPAELFYLRARGIPTREAQRLLVFGFLDEVIEKIPTEEAREYVRQLAHGKF